MGSARSPDRLLTTQYKCRKNMHRNLILRIQTPIVLRRIKKSPAFLNRGLAGHRAGSRWSSSSELCYEASVRLLMLEPWGYFGGLYSGLSYHATTLGLFGSRFSFFGALKSLIESAVVVW